MTSILKYDVYDFTRLDRESPLVGQYSLGGGYGDIYDGVTGGIPYKPDETDPTIYPLTSLKVGSVRGYNVVTGLGATKYTEPYDPYPSKNDERVGLLTARKSTYLDFISPYISGVGNPRSLNPTLTGDRRDRDIGRGNDPRRPRG